MNCKDVKENLSAYIDDMLDKQIRTLVDEHLAVCRSCRQELASLLFVIEDLKDAGSLKAPENFIESLHDRLSAPSYWSRIKEILFVPAQIKIPLEFAAVSIVAVLVFTVYSVYSPGNHIAGFMKDAVMESSGEEPVVHEAEALKQDAQEQAEIATDADYEEAVKPQAVELALVLVKEPAPAAYTDTAGKAKTYSAARALSEEKGGSPVQAELSQALPKAEVPAEESMKAADESKEELPEPAIREQEGVPGTDRALFDDNESVRRILDLIGLSGGRVLSEETDSAGSGDLIVISEIPSGQYGAFMEKLAGIAELKDPPPPVPEDNKGSILVKMRLIRY